MIDYMKKNKKLSIMFALVVFIQIVTAVVVGSRDLTIGHDTYRYAQLYESIKSCLCFDGGVEKGFQSLSFLFAYFDASYQAYFIGISMLLFFLVNFTSYKYTELFSLSVEKYSHEYWQLIYLALLIYLWSPFYVSSHINAIRQGIASFFVYLALFTFILKNWRVFILSTIAAVSFHHTALMYIVFFPLLLLNLNIVLGVVFALSASYAMGLSEIFIEWFSNSLNLGVYEKISNYQIKVNYERGIRYDFLLFSWLMGLAGYIIYSFFSSNNYRNGLAEIIKVYFLLLIPFCLFGFATFSNRFLYTAWLFLPFLAAASLCSINIWQRWRKPFFYSLSVLSPLIFIFMALNGIAR